MVWKSSTFLAINMVWDTRPYLTIIMFWNRGPLLANVIVWERDSYNYYRGLWLKCLYSEAHKLPSLLSGIKDPIKL